ncbi:unnamed protein product [Rotaria sp. Silwood2]|nr:unnamed protein product [Rotaria sp. Silwood2]
MPRAVSYNDMSDLSSQHIIMTSDTQHSSFDDSIPTPTIKGQFDFSSKARFVQRLELMREMYTNAADISPTSPDQNLESILTGDMSTSTIQTDPFYDRFPWFRPIGRAFVYLTNLLYGIPLVQNVAIVSEHGEIKGYLKVAVQQLQTTDTTNEQIKLMRTYRNASGMTKIIFDDENYFQTMKSSSTGDLIKACDSMDSHFRYVEGQSQFGLNDILQQKMVSDFSPSSDLSKLSQIILKNDISSNEFVPQLGIEYQFRVTVLEASQISSDYADIFCQFNFLHQHHEAYSTEPLKNQGKPGPPLGFFHVQNFSVIVTHSFVDYLRTKPIVFEVMGHYQEYLSPTKNNLTTTTTNRSPTTTVASLTFSKPVPAQTLNPIAAVSSSYISNVLKLLKIRATADFRVLRKQVNRKAWGFSAPTVVNAFYAPSKNQITFPAGILQMPFFDRDAPKYLNYGGIGVVIGHEITHGFDNSGRQFDKDGNRIPWWTDETIQEFNNRKTCIVNQYSNYTVPQSNIKANGNKTQGEDIADNGGLREAFFAYQKWAKANPNTDQKLPGLSKYTPEQMFFINYAHTWCSKMTDSYTQNRVLSDVHSLGQFRVIGPTSNFVEFDRVFNCRPGQGNSRVQKCIVW